MTQDKSREKSLLFLLSTVSRTLEAPSENKAKIRESIGSLLLKDSGDKWEISVLINNEHQKKIEIAKDRFIFYPVKSATRYEINPAILNKNSAQDVLLFLFAEYGVKVPGKKFQPVEQSISEIIPYNLIIASLFTLFSIFNLELIGAVTVIAHLFFSTKRHHYSSIRRSALVLSVASPSIVFLFINSVSTSNVQTALSQIAIMFLFDVAIRVESRHKGKFWLSGSRTVTFIGFILIFALLETVQISVILMGVIVVISRIILSSKITSSIRNILVLTFLAMFLVLIVMSILVNPYKLLLLPYLMYIAIYETLFGDNRNPAKLAFGAVCLAI